MELEIAVVCACVVALLFILCFLTLSSLARIEEMVIDGKVLISELFDALNGSQSEITPPTEVKSGRVTDPFEQPKEIYQSSAHIIVPKTPDQIRNENFRKIQEGAEYGSAM